jgi:hypothetical protein
MSERISFRDGGGNVNPIGWSALPDEIEPVVFAYCGPRERVVVLERVCRHWRDESRSGRVWTTTFDCRSALWRDFVRFDDVGGAATTTIGSE